MLASGLPSTNKSADSSTMNKSKSKSKKSDKSSLTKDDNRSNDTKMNSSGGAGGGSNSSSHHHPYNSSASNTTSAAPPPPGGAGSADSPHSGHQHSANPGGTGATAATTPGGNNMAATPTGGAGSSGGAGGGGFGLVSSSSSTPLSKTAPSVWFATEIQQMMHGFGDCRKPLAESANLIEEIVHQQMTTLLIQASDVAVSRGARFIGIEDLLFLLRRDKTKLRRLLKYMALKDRSASLKVGAMPDEEDPSDPEVKQPTRKKRKICYDFLASIDQTGELLALFDEEGMDEVKMERALRAELQTRHMDAQQYVDYCEARQTSFTPRYKSQKFKDWLMLGMTLDLKPNPLAIEVFSYLAYETVAQIVDLSLLVKRDMAATVEDPFLSAMPPVCLNHEIPSGPNPKQGGSGAPSKSPSRAGSPTTTPPSTPTTPSPATGVGGSGPSLVPTPSPASASSGGSKPKPKKRKKSGSQQPRDSYYQAIQPSDIREALRRFTQNTGPFADFSKAPMISPKTKLLCR